MNKPAPPPPVRTGAPANSNTTKTFAVSSGKVANAPQRTVLFGPGGIGKSTLASLAPNPVLLDLERGTGEIDTQRITDIETFADLRACLQSDALDPFKTTILDSATRAEEMATTWTFENVPDERGQHVERLEDYSYGKGPQHIYDTFLLLLMDLDAQIRAGRNVILIAHDCTNEVPNPAGENFLRYEPHLQAPKSGRSSIRNRVVQWADHVLFIGYDVLVSKTGKGQGGGTRTIWPIERPDHIAKSRTLSEPMPYRSADDGEIWTRIFGGTE